MKRFYTLLLIITLSFASQAQKAGDVVVLFENDVHCAIEGYPVMAGLRDQLQAKGCEVAIVSAGDFSFGGPVGAASRGEFVIRMMNAVGYDAAVLGNHEFDYGLNQLKRLEDMLNAPLVCCNFTPNEGGELPFRPFVLRNYGGVNIAFVGVTTPTTMYTSTPTSFQDAEGNFIYNFSSNTLAATIQRNVDAARAAGADLVVLLSHLGDKDGVPTSVNIASKLCGVDVILDGHDHHILPASPIADKCGSHASLTSTGTQFEKLGMMVVSPGKAASPTYDLQFKLLSTDSLRRAGCVSQSVADTLKVINDLFEAMGNRIVANSATDLESQIGDIRVCRLRETNLGDLVTDAYRIMMDADIGWVNGGGIRANVPAGPITHNQLFAVCPYSNKICVIRATGQDIINALETAVREYPKAEGCFAQVSGLSFTFDGSIPSGVVLDSNGVFLRVDGAYRVSNVKVGLSPIDPARTYTIAGTPYVLLNGGDAISFPSRELLRTAEVNDLALLELFIQEYLHGNIAAPYDKPQGRITMK